MLHGVIMAGGSGTRFWPKSRRKTPKQLLSMTGTKSMIQETFARLNAAIPAERISVVTNSEQAGGVRLHLPELPQRNVIVEPCGRNTAACIGLAALYVANEDPDAVMVIVPADSYIHPPEAFLEVISAAADVALQHNTIVTIGIPPTFPATGYGYIHCGERLPAEAGVNVFDVVEFKEKPTAEKAAEFLQSGNFFWNSGSFVWKVSTIFDAFREHMPALYASLERIAAVLGTSKEADVIADEYARLENISIDYGVMERARNVRAIEATYAWDDVGSWKSVENLKKPDAHGNVVDAHAEIVGSADCTIVGEKGHLIAAVGVKDLIIVQTPDATLVCHKDSAQDVKKIVDILKEKKMDEYL